MNLLYNTTTQKAKTYKNGYTIDGVLQPMGQLTDSAWHLEKEPNERPETTDTQVATSEWIPDFEENKYVQVWTVRELTETELAIRDWRYPEWAKRIVAPIELILDDLGVKMYGWFQLNGLPVEKVNETTVHLYCDEILEQHQAIVDGLGEVVTVEDRPEILT